MNDPYKNSVRIYDRFIDGMNKGLKLVGLRVFRPAKGMRILDVGCGTGTHLELYQRFQCCLYGLDLSPSMLAVAGKRLSGIASLELGDATRMPYVSSGFDLVIAMLTLHEMRPQTREAVITEMKRVRKPSGHFLLIDYNTGPYQPLEGWTSKGIILLAELLAGREHFKNYRNFLSAGGLAGFMRRHGLQVEKQHVLAGGTFIVSLAA